MSFHIPMLDQVRKTFGLLQVRRENHTDFLARMNLPPLMGRRDAALDRAGEILRSDLFGLDGRGRAEEYRRVEDALRVAIGDTHEILTAITSADTRSREDRILTFLRRLEAGIGTARLLSGLDEVLYPRADGGERVLGAVHSVQRETAEQLFSEGEISIVHRLREMLDDAEPSLNRFREYVAKSFSKQNSVRYRLSYDSWMGRDIPDNLESTLS